MKRIIAGVVLLAGGLTGGWVLLRDDADTVASSPAAAQEEVEKAVDDPQKAGEEAVEVGKDAGTQADEAARDPSQAPEKVGAGADDVAGEDKKPGAGGTAAGEDEEAASGDTADKPKRKSRRSERSARRSSGERRVHRVSRGDNLWVIAERQLGEGSSDREIANRVVRIARINELRDPDLILTGDSLRLRA